MPNWTYTDYLIEGDKNQLSELFLLMKQLEDLPEPLIPNTFGNTWLGNIVVRLGLDPSAVECRGHWSDLYHTQDSVSFSTECAWHEQDGVRLAIKSKFPDLKIWYQSTADDFWITNDKEGRFFNRYYLYTEEVGEDYYRRLEDLIVEVESLTGCRKLQTLSDCENALIQHYEDETQFYIGEFDYDD